MIDAHCVVHAHAEMKYFPRMLKSMVGEDVPLHMIYGTENLGEARCRGWMKGKNEWVTFVDYDDMVIPGIFGKLQDIITNEHQIWYTDEILINEHDDYMGEGWSSNPDAYNKEMIKPSRLPDGNHMHHLFIMHRDCLSKEFIEYVSNVYWNPEPAAIKHIIDEGGSWKRIPLFGYAWRIHSENSSRLRHKADVMFDHRHL